VLAPEAQDDSGIADGRVDLEAIPHDPRVGEESLAVGRTVVGHPLHGEAVVGLEEVIPLLEDGQPGKARLVDLQHESAEEAIIVSDGKPVFQVVVGPVERVVCGVLAAGE
jgi:hypothetical protein